MKMASPLKYTEVTDKQYEQFRLIAKSHGMNITGNKDTVNYDSVGVAVTFDKEKGTLEFQAHEPFWMAPGTFSGHLHSMVAEAMARDFGQGPQPSSIRRPQDPGFEDTLSKDEETRDAAKEHNERHGHNVKEINIKETDTGHVDHGKGQHAAAHPAHHK